MHQENNKNIVLNFILFVFLNYATFLIGKFLGFNFHQIIAWTIFSISVWGTLLFWSIRLPIAFIGIVLLLATRTLDLENLIKFASLEVILFLVGMMVLVAALEEVKFFDWIIMKVVSIGKFTAINFVIVISILSALFSCLVGEVTSIIFMAAMIMTICKKFNVSAVPFIIISVLTTNIGSAGTMLGNPIGILIGTKAGLTFEDFIVHSFPLMVLSLIVSIIVLLVWYRKDIKEFDKKIAQKIKDREIENLTKFSVPNGLTLRTILFLITLLFISLHHRLELKFGLEKNTLIVAVPLFFAGIIMSWDMRKARKYIKENVDWWTLLFFMLLFAKAGTLKYTGIADVFAKKMTTGIPENFLLPIILWSSSIGSSILDNVVLVAAYIPIINSLKDVGINVSNLWWALLFGGCFGGNITMVGSTANIIALGMLEERENYSMPFLRWFWVGLTIGVITTIIVWIGLMIKGG